MKSERALDRPMGADNFRDSDNRDVENMSVYQEARIEALKRRIVLLEEALTKYAKHLDYCSQRAWPCSCGLEEIRGKKTVKETDSDAHLGAVEGA